MCGMANFGEFSVVCVNLMRLYDVRHIFQEVICCVSSNDMTLEWKGIASEPKDYEDFNEMSHLSVSQAMEELEDLRATPDVNLNRSRNRSTAAIWQHWFDTPTITLRMGQTGDFEICPDWNCEFH